MRAARSLMLSLALAAAVASAHRGGHHPTMEDHMHREEGDSRRHHRHEEGHAHHRHPEKDYGLMDYLNEQFQESASLVQQFLGLEAGEDVVVVVEEEPEALSREEARLACLTAVTRIREQDALKETGDELSSRLHASLRSAFQLVSVHYLDETSCEDLASQLQIDECNRIVGMEDEVRAFLEDGKSDAEVCETVTAATAGGAVEDLWELEDCSEAGSDLSCTMCKRFIQMVDQALEQQAQGIEQVRAIIGDLCQAMAEDSMCHVFLKHYDEVVDWLKHGTDPDVVCNWLQMCSPTPAPPKVPLLDTAETEDYALSSYEAGKKPHGCFFCVHVAEVVHQVNKTEPEKLPIVKTILDNVCKLAPSDCKCDEIDKDFDKLVQLVQQGECPHKVCKSLGFCKKPEPDNQLVVVSADSTLYGNACVYCDAATTVLEILLQEQPDQVDMIHEYADMICGMLGDDNVCHQYVNQLDTVIDSLKKGVHPRDICKSLKYCPATTAIGQFAESAKSTALVLSSDDVDHHHHHGCRFCIQVGVVIHHVNKTEPTKLPILKDLLTNVCELAPSDCNCTTVAKNFDKIVELEKEGKCPFQACKAIGVCTKKDDENEEELTSADDMDVSEAIKSVVAVSMGNDTNCAYCTYATTIIRIAIMQYGQEIGVIRQYADMICDMLGADSGCHVYVNQLDIVLDGIKAGKSSHEICALLKYCSASSADLIAMRSYDDMDEEALALTVPDHHHHHHGCSFCIRVAMVVRHVNQTAPAKLPVVKKILDDACQLVPADCKCDVVDKNFDTIVELVKNGTCPIKICKSIGVCKKPSPLALTQEQVDTEPFLDTVLALVTADYDPELDGNLNCYVCDYVTTLVQVALEQDAAKVDQVRSFADALCDLLGDESGCHQYVKQLDFVLDSLKNGTHPHAVCVSMKYCASNDSSSLPQLASPRQDDEEFDPALVVMVEDAMLDSVDDCFFCSQVTTVVQVVLQQNPSQIDMIRQIADMVCGMLPAENKCHAYVKDFDAVVDALKKGEEPKQICQELKYCPAKWSGRDEEAAVVVSEVAAKGNTTCAYCSGLVTVLKYALAQDADQVKQLREAAGIVCELLPADDQCHEDLKLFDQAVKELEAGKEPHVICQDLKFCSATEVGSALTVWDLLRFVDPESVPSKCSACKQNTLLLATMVSQPDRLATFSQELDTVCRLIPDSDECQLLVSHQSEIVDALKRGDNVDAICERIDACESSVAVAETDDTFSVGCLFCEYTATLVKAAGTNERELRLAKSTLETMCTILPPCAHCDVLSSKFDEMVALLQSGKTPGEACRAIALCSASASVEKPDAVATALEQTRVALGDVIAVE